MPLDLRTDKARRQYHKIVLQIMAKLERVIARQLKPMINRQYMDAASLITQGIKDVDHVVNLQTTRLRQILRAHYRRVAMTSGRQATIAYDPAKSTKSMGDSFWNEVNQFIAVNTGRKIKQMQDTTKKMLAGVIQKGVEGGETNREIATRLRNTGKVDSKFRALRIARTETLGIYNSATEASVNETGLKFIRVWSTTKDLRTRRRKKKSFYDHWIVDGQKRKQGEPFDVSGEKLMFPGDPNGSAGNIINCRCVLMYERDRSAEMKPTPISGLKPVSSLPVSLADNLFSIENDIKNNPVESAFILDDKGKLILQKKGGQTAVEFTKEEVALFKNKILTHNHPSGVSFSNNDLRMAHNAELKEIRAVSKDYLYKAQINKKANIDDLVFEFDNAEANSIAMDLNYDKFMPLAEAGKITEKQAWKSIRIETTHDNMKRAANKYPDWIKYERSKIK